MRTPTLLATLMLAGAAPLFAQTSVQEAVRSDIRAEAQKLMTVGMALPAAEAEKFWPIYREYEIERAAWNDRRVAAIKDYAAKFETLDDKGAESIAKGWFKLQDDRLKLWEKYYDKVSKALSPAAAARFVQIEHQLNLVMDLQVAPELPLIFKAAP